MRNDMACGSTIGPVTSSKIGVAAVDIGAASLGMHSIREVTGSQDPLLMYTVISHFLRRDTLPTVTQACDVESA
jgi:aspartyl aminopeptidase